VGVEFPTAPPNRESRGEGKRGAEGEMIGGEKGGYHNGGKERGGGWGNKDMVNASTNKGGGAVLPVSELGEGGRVGTE
jgi:hypothetical protein